MSYHQGFSTRLRYDECAYGQTLYESTSPFAYAMYDGKNENCNRCVYDQLYRRNDGAIVDRAALQRMVMIRRELYRRFCRKAVLELPADHPMAGFCKSVADFFDNEEKNTST